MENILEDQSGWDSKFLNNSKMISSLASKASTLVGNFNNFKQQRIEAERKRKEAELKREREAQEREAKRLAKKAQSDADFQQREQEKMRRRIERKKNQAEAERQARKEVRDKKEKDRADERAAKAENLRQKMADGHIMQINYKFKYRELLLSFASSKIEELFKEGKIEQEVLPKLFKYGKSIETLLQKYPGTLVTSIRQNKFEQHPGMVAINSKTKGQSGKEDGPYRLIHPLFSPKDQNNVEHTFFKSLMSDYAEKVLFANTGEGVNSVGDSHNFGFSAETCVLNFNQILKATGVGTIDYIVIGWYNRTYNAVKNSGLNLDGVVDKNRSSRKIKASEPENDWGKTEYTQKFESQFPIMFFTKFSEVFETVRIENMRLYSIIEELIRHAGLMIDHDDVENANTNRDPDVDRGENVE